MVWIFGLTSILLLLIIIALIGVRRINNLDKHQIITPYQKKECARLGRSMKTCNDSYAKLEQIPLSFLQILISAEDYTFAKHHGIHWRFTFQAIFQNIVLMKKTGGGSTITQQLIKNLFFSFKRSLWRKLVEIIWALVIERYWTKTQILETYLNVIEFGEGVFGIQNASLHYFHKDCSQLTTKESLWLVSILPNPKKLSKASDSWHALRSNELCRRMPFSDLSFLDPKNLNERIATSYKHRLTIVYALARKNPHYRAKRPLQPKGLMLHSVGFPQPRAKPHMAYQNRKKYTRACVHGFLDAISGITYRTIRWDRRAAHAGGEANNTHLGIELCEPQTIQYLQGADWIDHDPVETKKVVLFTYNQAVKLFAHLCEHLNLNPLEDGVIISHSEGFKRGIASDHKDVEHLWNHFGLTMDQFRRDVAEQMKMSKDDIFVEYITPEHAKSRMIE